MLYLTLIIAPAVAGLILGFSLPKLILVIWQHKNRANIEKDIKEKERRLICIR